MSLELTNKDDSRTMGVIIEQPDDDDGGGVKIVYQPWIMWNLEILSYISAPIEISKYRGYKCLVKVSGGGDFTITFDANEFHHSFKKVHETIVKKTHGVLILTHFGLNSFRSCYLKQLHEFSIKDPRG